MNIVNLKLLADFLAVSPIKPSSFNMTVFNEEHLHPLASFEVSRDVGVNFCGTPACAVGWAPSVPGLPEPTDSESYNRYSKRIFDLYGKINEWLWMFSSAWSMIDDTPHGAAARIYALIDGAISFGPNEDMDEFIKGFDVDSYSKYLPDSPSMQDLICLYDSGALVVHVPDQTDRSIVWKLDSSLD
jgi:hypothetical protein